MPLRVLPASHTAVIPGGSVGVPAREGTALSSSDTTTLELDLTDAAVHDHWVDERVRFSDTDAMGHVNNVAYAALIESGRVGFGVELMAQAEEPPRFILRRIVIDYRAELTYPAAVRVGSCVLRVGRTSFTVGTGVFSDERCVATAESVLVRLDEDDGAAPIAGGLRTVLEERVPR